MKRKPLCILTLHFSDAFDRISHQCLFAILHSYGCSNSFVDRISHMYTDASSVVQVNGHLPAPFPIQCSLSMTLCALCISPLIYILEQQLRGIRVNWSQRKTAVVAYADDVTILVTAPEEIAAIKEALRRYEEATGAKLNIVKSHAMVGHSEYRDEHTLHHRSQDLWHQDSEYDGAVSGFRLVTHLQYSETPGPGGVH